MIKKNSVKKKSIEKKHVKKSIIKKNDKNTGRKRVAVVTQKESSYKKGLLEINEQEEKYNKVFEQKLAEQYREFRNLKEHHMQSKKFLRIILILVTIVLIALLLLSYRV